MNNLYGLFGEKLSHSISPQIHSLFFKQMNMEAYYHLFEIKREDLKTAVEGLKVLGAKGINVTIPYKVDIMECLDEISSEAKSIGAVNTVCFENGRTIGYNSDYFGFGMMLHKNSIEVENKRAVILGSGGVAKTVFHYLADRGIQDVTVVVRNKKVVGSEDGAWKLQWMAEIMKNDSNILKVIDYKEAAKLKDRDLLVNCTPSGMYPKLIHESPLKKEEITCYSAVVDLIFNPKETLLLKYARENNIKAVNGLYMLVAQGIVSEGYWNKMNISQEIIDKIYDKLENYL